MRAPLTAGIAIQGSEHSSVDDARAAMALYRRFSAQWESDRTARFRAGAEAEAAEVSSDDGEYADAGVALVHGDAPTAPQPTAAAPRKRMTNKLRRRYAERNGRRK